MNVVLPQDQRPAFAWRAIAQDGSIATGVLSAASLSDARSVLLSRNLLPMVVTAKRAATARRTAISSADTALIARLLAELLDSGLPLARALSMLGDLAPESWRPHLPGICDHVRSGASLSDALASTGGAVRAEMIGLVRAGELGTGLAASLRSVADVFDASAAARSALISALTYPAFLLVACTGSLLLLIGAVLPRFAAMLSDLNQALPPSTAMLMNGAAVVRVAAPQALIILVPVALALATWARSANGRAKVHAFMLDVPVLGDLRLAWASATACGTASALLAAGIPVPAALAQASETCNDAAVAARLSTARREILTGRRMSEALTAARALTATCTRMIRAGEESGMLATMMDRAARLERARVTRTTQRVLKLLEPALVLGFGALVAFVAASLLQAVYAVRPGA
jgi:general secretion pathway protein F